MFTHFHNNLRQTLLQLRRKPLEHGEIVADQDELVVSLTPARVEEEPEVAEEATEDAEPELVREKREDEEDAG